MNIVWFTWKDLENPSAGGAERVNEELAARLAADGHIVTFLTSRFDGSSPTAARRGFSVVRTGGRFGNYLTSAQYFLEHRARLAPDLVIDECNTMPYFSGWYTRAPTAVFFHMLCRRIWFYEFPLPLAVIGWLAEPLYLRLLNAGQRIVTVSESTRRDLMRHGFRSRDISVISEATHLRPVVDLGLVRKFQDFTILSHGSIRPMKRTLDQVKAFEIAKRSIKDLKLIVSGDASGSYGAQVVDYCRASPFAADITLLGRTTDDEKVELMQRCHVITVTSVKEGWGLIVTEAASQGTPAVVYDVDGLRDAVKHGQTGLVAQKNTPACLADATESLLQDAKTYAAYRDAGWRWSQELSFDRSYADFTKCLAIGSTRQVVEGHGGVCDGMSPGDEVPKPYSS